MWSALKHFDVQSYAYLSKIVSLKSKKILNIREKGSDLLEGKEKYRNFAVCFSWY
jgi:hypothetical protein